MDPRLLDIVRCPATGQRLRLVDGALVSADGAHSYEVIDGIPCLMADLPPTHSGYSDLLDQNGNARSVDLDSFMDGMIVPTCGNLFHGVKLRGRYPIPDFPADLPMGLTLDIGCNWGRWSIAGARSGRQMVGVDIHLESLFAARELAARFAPDNPPLFVLADARRLPFAPSTFAGVFSYSVVQHFSKANAAIILDEVGRVLRDGGASKIQMPNRQGLKALLTLARRGFAEGEAFDVRYYSVDELLRMFGRIGEARWAVDCFFGLNVHGRDRDLIPLSRRWIVTMAEAFYRLSQAVPVAGRFSDSVYVTAQKA